jgi:DUF4097 and DUF4098 domain-containing protein YvlB
MTQNFFETHEPVDLQVEIGKGSVTITCSDTTETRIEVEGRDADQTRVEQHGSRIEVIGPRQRGGFFGSDSELNVTAVVPTASNVAAKTGSADVTIEGDAGSTAVKSGSGDVKIATSRGPSVLETGSGDVQLDHAQGDLRVKSGSGDVLVGHSERTVVVSTGSGDVKIGASHAETVIKTGSGDLRVGEAHDDVSLATGSGDFVIDHVHRGRLSAKGASGDVRVGIPSGLPVWTDLTTVSGRIRSSLEGAGQPAEGQDHVELRAKTVSGDIVLTQI